MNMIEVKTAELIGSALDWAVAQAIGQAVVLKLYRVYPTGESYPGLEIPDEWDDYGNTVGWKPSTEWEHGGPLIQKYGVLLSPPTSMVHRNFGNFDARNGYYESGVWSTTIFGTERKHRRKSFDHPDQPLVAAMRVIVQFELGDVVSVPAELVQGGAV